MLIKQWTCLKSQQKFKNEAHNVYSEEISKIALSNNDDKRLQTFHKIVLYTCGASNGKICKKELLECLNIKWLSLMMLLKKNKTKHNQNWPYIPDHLYRTLITGDCGSGKKKMHY